MKKLKLQMQISLDGYAAAGPDDEQKWVTWAWDEIKPYVVDFAASADVEVIGRKLATDYIPFWLDTATKPEDPMYAIATIFESRKKVVFSKTLDNAKWPKTEIAKGKLVDEIVRLKNEPGKDIMVCGGVSFVSSLLKEELIDEFQFYINPVILGSGWRVFDEVKNWQRLKVIKTITFKSGLVLLHYAKQS